MDKRHIIEEIVRLAAENDGTPPGWEKFLSSTGIKRTEWFPHHWLRWSEALLEAGFKPNQFVTAFDDNLVIEKYIALVRELGRLPVHDGELIRKAKSDDTFPSTSVFARLGGKDEVVSLVAAYCRKTPGHEDVLALCEARIGTASKSREEKTLARAPIQGYVYMMRSGKKYKIGFTSSPVRRHREVRLELPDPTNLVHSIETDDPRGIEAYWHRRFDSKRIRDTEFFNLDASDVAAFRRRKYQ